VKIISIFPEPLSNEKFNH